jgi:hypothetical protein
MSERDWPALVFTSRKLLRVARKAANRSKTEKDQALVAILFAAAAVEGFLNDIMEFAAFAKRDPQANTLHVLLSEAEQQKAQVALKFQIINSVCRGTTLPRGDKLYQDFDLLFKLRNDLVHIRPGKARSGFWGPTERKPHKAADRLIARGIVSGEQVERAHSWLEIVTNQSVAEWACATAVEIATAVYQMIDSSILKSILHDGWSRKGQIKSIALIGEDGIMGNYD